MITKVPPGNRIAKILSRSGIASRREAEKLILKGKVKVNGKLIYSPALNLLETDIIKSIAAICPKAASRSVRGLTSGSQ